MGTQKVLVQQNKNAHLKQEYSEVITLNAVQKPFSLLRYVTGLGKGCELHLESLSVLDCPWRDAWTMLSDALSRGIVVTLIQEDIILKSVHSPAAKIFALVASFEQARHEKTGGKRAATRLKKHPPEPGKPTKSGAWVAPDDELLGKVQHDINDRVSVVEICSKYNFSRRSFYNWVNAGLLKK